MSYRTLGLAALVGYVVCFGTIHAAESLCCTHETYICFSAPTPVACGINAAGVDSCDECFAPQAAGSVEPLTLDKVTGPGIRLSWGASCISSDSDYAVYEGLLGSFNSHVPVGDAFCSTQGMRQVTITPADGSRYYLVVPFGAMREGSYGTDGDGAPRPPSAQACLPQLVGDCP
ncbi:MAG: hypothetical protein GY716_10720 [bacterium]|nr:hypothetical protein [bacterium]